MKTFKSLYKDFLSEVQKHRVGSIVPSEFAILFNQAQEEVVTNKLAAIELNKKITDDLIPLISSVKGSSMTEFVGDLMKCFTFERPVTCRRISKITITLNSTNNAKCILLKGNMETEMLNSVYGKPSIRQTYYKFDNINNKVVIKVYVPILTTSVKIYLDYYSNPEPVTEQIVISDTVECKFSKEMCTEIINVAARMCLERNQDARNQTFNADLKNKNSNQ